MANPIIKDNLFLRDNKKLYDIPQFEYNCRDYVFTLHDADGYKIDLTNCTQAAYLATKEDGNVLGYELTFDIENSTVTYTPPLQATTCKGRVTGVIELQFSDRVGNLRYYGVNFNVQKTIQDAEIESTTDFRLLDILIAEAKKIIEQGITPEQIEKITEEVKKNLDLSDYAKKEELGSELQKYVDTHKSELKGDKGDKGEPGQNGADGLPGPQGEKGEQGERGEAGPQGEQGPQGVPGEAGPPGRDGADGQPGEPGKDYVMTEQDKQEIAQQASELIDIDSKIDKPSEQGVPGQVLGLDENGLPIWLNQQGGGAEKWKLIKTVEITEDVQNISVDFEPNNYDEVIMRGVLKGSSNSGSTHIAGRVSINDILLSSILTNAFPKADSTLNIYEIINLKPQIYLLGTNGVTVFVAPTSLGPYNSLINEQQGLLKFKLTIYNSTANYLSEGTNLQFYAKE